MTDIVLINPPVEQVIEEHDAPEYPHIGIGYLASNLESHGFMPIIIDAKLEKLSFDKTVERVLSFSPKIIGITAMTHEIAVAHGLIVKLKFAGCNALMIIGGVHVTALPQKTLQEFPAFNVGVIGEGEYTLVELSKCVIRQNNSPFGIPGTVYRDIDGEVHLAPEKQFIEDLDGLPFPAWHLFPPAKQYPILTSRGCPARCIFCAHSYGYTLRERSPNNILLEWEHVVSSYSPRLIRMYDETFGINKKRAMKFLGLIIENRLTTPWFGHTRANVASPELMQKMKESGCIAVGIGVETGDPGIMRAIRKGITIEQAENAIKYIHDAGMSSEAYFILGFPNETISTVLKTIRFASRLKSTKLSLGIMVPYPGTRIASMAEAGEGGYKIISKDWSDYNKQLGNALELEQLSRQRLEFFQAIGYVYFYLSNGRIIDFSRFVWDYRSQAIGFVRHFFRRLLIL